MPAANPCCIAASASARSRDLFPDSLGLFSLGHIGAFVPHHHRPGAVLALFEHAFEVAILQGVVGRGHRQALQMRIERRTLGDRPGRHHAADLEAEIVVQGGCLVLVDDKDQALVQGSQPTCEGVQQEWDLPLAP